MCRSEIEDVSTWRNNQEEILRLQRVERFAKVEKPFPCQHYEEQKSRNSETTKNDQVSNKRRRQQSWK